MRSGKWLMPLLLMLLALYWTGYALLHWIIRELDASISPLSLLAVLAPCAVAVAITIALCKATPRTRRTTAVLWISLILITLPVAACLGTLSLREYHEVPRNEREQLERRVKEVIAREGAQIDFRREVEREWDRLVVIDPYISGKQANERLGFHWTNMSWPISHDSFYILLFVHDQRVVQQLSLRGSINFGTYEGRVFTPEQTLFTVQSANGYTVLQWIQER